MIRFLFRALATVSLAAAVIMAVVDATRTLAASELVMTPLAESWAAVSPATFARLRDFVVTMVHPLVWDPAMLAVLALPGFAVFAVLALIFYAIGHRPERRVGRFAAET
jgi:hypothetical protein